MNTIASTTNTTKNVSAAMWGETIQPIMDTVLACRVLGTRVFLNGQKNGQCRPFAQVALELIPKKNLKEVTK